METVFQCFVVSYFQEKGWKPHYTTENPLFPFTEMLSFITAKIKYYKNFKANPDFLMTSIIKSEINCTGKFPSLLPNILKYSKLLNITLIKNLPF